MHRLHQCANDRGFTLVELLVVIAIIALLVSILMPTLQQARALAIRAKCAAQLHGVGMGILFYTHDWDLWMPHSGKTSTSGLYLADGSTRACRLGLLYITGARTAMSFAGKVPGTDTYNYDLIDKGSYISTREMLDCPDVDWSGMQPYWRARLASYSYCVPISSFNSAATFCYRIDRDDTPWWWRPGLVFKALVGCYRGNGVAPADCPHQDDGGNCLYKDGHVEFVQRPENGWGTNSWMPDIPENEVGNTYDAAGFWMIANGGQRSN